METELTLPEAPQQPEAPQKPKRKRAAPKQVVAAPKPEKIAIDSSRPLELYTRAELASVNLEDIHLNSLIDYKFYNACAKAQRKPTKKAPTELHPKGNYKVYNLDQPGNYIRGLLVDELIDYEFTIPHASVVNIPHIVAHHLNTNCMMPIYDNRKNTDGNIAAIRIGERPRFSAVPA